MKGIFSVLVENKDGVLSQIAGLFARRGFNIDSLAVGETDKHDVSSMTIVSTAIWLSRRMLPTWRRACAGSLRLMPPACASLTGPPPWSSTPRRAWQSDTLNYTSN